MDRAEATGLGVAAAGHAALIVLLSLGFASTRLPQAGQSPIEVAFVEEVGLESTAPKPTQEPPAPLQGPTDVPPAPAMPSPPVLQAVPQPQQRSIVGTAVPARPRPTPNAPPQQNTRRRDAGGLQNVVEGLADRETDGRSADPPAAAAGPQVEASLVAEIRRQVKPHWQRAVPSGADMESLRTKLTLNLSRDGRIVSIAAVETSGVTASNRPQVALHQERAKRAVTLAAPYDLPAKFYDVWKQIDVVLDLRLSR